MLLFIAVLLISAFGFLLGYLLGYTYGRLDAEEKRLDECIAKAEKALRGEIQ